MSDDEYHARQIERHAALLRGREPDEPLTPDDYRIPSGKALKLMREACGLSVADVAGRVDKSAAHLYQIESDSARPGSGLLVALLRLYRHEWPEDASEVPAP